MKHRNNDPNTTKLRLGKVVKRLHEQRQLIETMRFKGLDTKSSEVLFAILSERAEGLSQTLNELRSAKRPSYAERQQASEASVRALIQEDQRKQTDQSARLREARLERDSSIAGPPKEAGIA
jgi:hypothetical protein